MEGCSFNRRFCNSCWGSAALLFVAGCLPTGQGGPNNSFLFPNALCSLIVHSRGAHGMPLSKMSRFVSLSVEGNWRQICDASKTAQHTHTHTQHVLLSSLSCLRGVLSCFLHLLCCAWSGLALTCAQHAHQHLCTPMWYTQIQGLKQVGRWGLRGTRFERSKPAANQPDSVHRQSTPVSVLSVCVCVSLSC